MKKSFKVLVAALGLATSGSLFAAAPNISTEVVTKKLELPCDMAFFQNGTMLFTEKCKG